MHFYMDGIYMDMPVSEKKLFPEGHPGNTLGKDDWENKREVKFLTFPFPLLDCRICENTISLKIGFQSLNTPCLN